MTHLNPPSVLVEEGAHAASGELATLTVHVRNLAAEPVDLHVSVIGLEPTWVPESFAVPGVGADETVTVTVPIVPLAGAAPADYPFVVAVEAVVGGIAARSLADAVLRVDGTSELVLSVEPVEARGVRSAAVDVVLVNASDAPAEVHLHAVGRQGLEVDVPSRPVVVAARETVRVGARVRSPRVRLVGSRRRYAYAVTATGRAAPQQVQASMSVRPLVTSGFARFVAVFAVLALWATSVFAVLPYLADRFSDRSTSVDSVTVEADGDTEPGGEDADPGAGPGAGGGAAPGAGEEGGEDGGEDALAGEQVRASGQITGASPDGVTVSVVPASSLWTPTAEDETDAQAHGFVERFGDQVEGTIAALHPALGGVRTIASLVALTRPAAASSTGKTLSVAVPLAPTDGSTQRMSVVSDAQGAWAIAGLSPSARYLVSVSKPGFQTQRVLRTGAELAAAPLETELRAGTGQLSGGVSGPEGAAGGVEITISDGQTTVTTRTATTGAVGRWQVDGLATPGTYLVTASSDRLGAQSRLVTLAPSGVRTLDLRLRPGLASVSGRVIGKDVLGGTSGIGGLTVTASDGKVTRSATTATGEESHAGTFVLPDLPVPATYTVTVSGAGYNTVTRELRLGPGGRTDWQISVGIEGGTVTGTVRSTAGPGVTGAGLTLSSETETFKTMSDSGGQGTYLFSGIPAGTYVLSAQSFGFASAFAQVEVTDGKESEVDLRLAPVPDDGLTSTGSITGRVTDARSGGRIECDQVFDASGCLVHARVDFKRLDGTPASLEAFVGPDDPYVLPEADSETGQGLPPGRYTVQLSAPGYEPGSVQVTVGMGVAAEAATVALVPSPSLTGVVIPRVGTLPSGTCVVVLPVVDGNAVDPTAGAANPCVSAPEVCNTFTSRCVALQNGSYTVDRLRAGQYEVSFRNVDPNYQTPPSMTLVLSPGELRRYDVTVERLGIINLTVLQAQDAGAVAQADTVDVRATSETDGTVIDLATTNGFASFSRLSPGTWRVAVVGAGGGSELVMTHVGIDLNQEVSAQLVITDDLPTFTFHVGWQKTDGVVTDIEGATVRVRGVTRYVGTLPSRETLEFRTNANGIATVCTTAAECEPGELPLALIDRIVDITVEAPGFQTVVWNASPVPDVNQAVLRPNGVTFDGQIALDPAPAPGAADPFTGITFEVVAAPPGTGQVSLTVAPGTGVVSFSDSAGSGGNRIRPGSWTIRADRVGHTSDSVTFEVEPGVDPGEVLWTLQRFGHLVVSTVNASSSAAVGEVHVTLSRDGEELGSRVTTAAGLADFGGLVPGDYVLQLRAAGFAPVASHPVTLEPGRAPSALEVVQLTQLGSISGTTRTRITSTWFQALGGATVTAERDTGEAPPAPAVESFDVTSELNGGYRVTGELDIPGLAAGTWRVGAAAWGHDDGEYVDPVSLTNAVPLAAGQQRTGVTVDLDPQRSQLTITVLDGEDRVPGLDVVMRWREGSVTHAVYPCTPAPGDPNDPCGTVDPGEYRFLDLLPIPHNISVSGGSFLSINVPHTVELASIDNLPIALTAPGGSVQGTLYQRTATGGATPLVGKVVELVPSTPSDPPAAPLVVTTPTNGLFSITDVPAGQYTLEAREPGPTGAVLVSRTVQISSGQATVVDLFVDAAAVSATVLVDSVNGTDLTGAQVTLSGDLDEGGTATFGPATLLRTAPGSDVFSASFPQLPHGEWTPTVTGPAGHLGSHVGDPVAVGSSNSDITMDVEEREVRLRASAPSGVTLNVPVVLNVGGGQFSANRTLQAGASDTVLFVPEASLALSATAPTGWTASVSPSGTVGSSGNPVTFVVSLLVAPSATSLSLCTSTPVILQQFSCSVQLTVPAGVSASGRTVSVTIGSTTSTLTTNASGSATISVPGPTVGTTPFTIDASWAGDGLTAAPVTTSRSYTPSGMVTQLSVSFCGGNATASTAFDCSIQLAGPSGFLLGNHEVTVTASRAGTELWTTELTTTGTGARTFTVPASAVGTENFTLTASWPIDGLTNPRTATRSVNVNAGGGGGGGG